MTIFHRTSLAFPMAENEILGKQKNMDTVEKINIAGNPDSDPSKIANQFNQFFTTDGKWISENGMPVRKTLRTMLNVVERFQNLISPKFVSIRKVELTRCVAGTESILKSSKFY
jgi:hypothetical protein